MFMWCALFCAVHCAQRLPWTAECTALGTLRAWQTGELCMLGATVQESCEPCEQQLLSQQWCAFMVFQSHWDLVQESDFMKAAINPL